MLSRSRVAWRLVCGAASTSAVSARTAATPARSGSRHRCVFTAPYPRLAKEEKKDTDAASRTRRTSATSSKAGTSKRTKVASTTPEELKSPTTTRKRSSSKKALSSNSSDEPPQPSVPSKLSLASSTQTQSSVARGTDFENLCGSVLGHVFGMELERCGGAGDKGIDLKGWWRVPSPSKKSIHDEVEIGRRIRVVAQCKCQHQGGKKIGPVIVREVEGVLHRAHASSSRPSTPTDSDESDDELYAPVLGIIASSSGFSKQALMQARSSLFPMMLLHVEQAGEAGMAEVVDRCQTIVWNDGLAGPRGLLEGRMEVRWKRSLVPGRSDRPVLFCDGRKMAL